MTGGERVIVDERFEGPPGSANGGYVCGLLAARMAPGPVRVTLRRPVPLGRPLTLAAIGPERLTLVAAADGAGDYAALVGDETGGQTDPSGELLVEAIAGAELEIGEPPAVDPALARSARPDEALLTDHPFPRCFGCGPERDPAEAVALHVGRIADELWATTWTPSPALPSAGGVVAPEIAWTALDCPGSFAAVPAGAPPHVLGRLEGEVLQPLQVGEEHVVLAWPLGHEGRKRWAATAILGPDGDLRARARATWIALA